MKKSESKLDNVLCLPNGKDEAVEIEECHIRKERQNVTAFAGGLLVFLDPAYLHPRLPSSSNNDQPFMWIV